MGSFISFLSTDLAEATDFAAVERSTLRVMTRLRAIAVVPARDRRDKRARRLVRRVVDLSHFADLALQDVASDLRPAERRAVAGALRALVEGRIVAQVEPELAKACLDPELSSDDRASTPTANVRLTIRCSNADPTTTLHLATREDRWVVVDAEFDGVLLSRQYRAMINKQLRERGAESLLRRLRELARSERPGGTD